MGNWSKLIGSVVGAVIGFAVSRGLLPAEFGTPEIIAGVTALFATLATALAPANKPAI